MARKNTRKKNFTLIEILVVIAIIGMLIALIFPVIGKAVENAHVNSTQALIGELTSACEAYQGSWGEYPPSHPTDINAANIALKTALEDRSRGSAAYIIPAKDLDETGTYIVDGFGKKIIYSHCRDYYDFSASPAAPYDKLLDGETITLDSNINSNSYQIISAGRDEEYGTYTSGGMSAEAEDNIWNH